MSKTKNEMYQTLDGAEPEGERYSELLEQCRIWNENDESFRERTQKAWAAFAEQEAELRRFMEEDRNHERGEELTGKCEQILNLAFEDISFEMGFNGRKPELILTPEGDKVKLFELVYFQKHAPAEVLEHWNILVGRQPAANMGLRSGEWEISRG